MINETQIRVPRIHGFPKQMFGSMEIRSRSFFLSMTLPFQTEANETANCLPVVSKCGYQALEKQGLFPLSRSVADTLDDLNVQTCNVPTCQRISATCSSRMNVMKVEPGSAGIPAGDRHSDVARLRRPARHPE